ncbi:hypothetical protein JCM8547_005372 [Rhodosporidiobolus lusitaniae]
MGSNNLVSIPFKPTDQLPSLAADLLDFLGKQSEHTHPDELRVDAQAWQATRERLFGAGEGGVPLVSPQVLEELSDYQRQLAFVSTKLPSSLSLSFPWYPLFTSSASSALPTGAFTSTSPPFPARSIKYERINVIYNIAAIHCQLGTQNRRSNEQGIKTAIAAFQNAAGLLAYLLSLLPHAISSLSANNERLPPDFAPHVFESLRDLCLAEAQEVAWQKAVMDRLKNGTVAKLALKTAELYQQAHGAASLTGVFAFPEDLSRFIRIKAAHFTAVAQYRRSLDDLGANRYGDELGRLQLADQRLKEAGSIGKRGVPESVLHDLKSLQKIISDNLARATKDNDLIYLAAPTPPSSLPPIVSAALARPTLPPNFDAPPSRPWLQQLVPKEVGEVIALWEDRKKEWLENDFEAEGKMLDKAAASTLSNLNLPASLDAIQQPLGVPASLLDKANTVQAEGGVERLETMMKNVRRVAKVNQKMLQESNDLLEQEAAADTAHRTAHGTTRWTRPASNQAAAPLLERAAQFGGVLASAAESDSLVRKKFGEWEEAVRVLEGGQPALSAAVPSAIAPPASSAQETSLARTLRAHLESLSDLRSSRSSLLSAARTAVSQADIRDRILREAEKLTGREGKEGAGNGLEAFEGILGEEMERLKRPFEEKMRRSEGRQEDLLGEIKTTHSAFLAARAVPPEVVQQREQALQHFDTAYAKFVEMKTNLQEGLRFYADLSKLLGQLREAAKSFNYTRSAEAHELAKALSAPPPLLPSPVPTPSPVVQPPEPQYQPSVARIPSTRRTAPPSALAETVSTPSRSSVAISSTPRSTRSSTRNKPPPSEPEPKLEPEPAYETEVEMPPPSPRSTRKTKVKKEHVGEEEEPLTPARRRVAVPAGGEWTPEAGIRFA